jgi:hypothetical protein
VIAEGGLRRYFIVALGTLHDESLLHLSEAIQDTRIEMGATAKL